jgi:hypothetical protein
VIAETRGERIERHREVARIDAEARERAARADAPERALERRLQAQRLDGDVGSAARESFDLGDDVLLFEVQHDVRAHALRELEALRNRVDADDEGCAGEPRPRRRAETDGPLREDHDRVAESHAAAFRRGEARGHDVRAEQHVFVLQRARDLGEVGLRVRHDDVFGLATVDRVSESPAADGLVAIAAVAALRQRAGEASATLPARGDGPDDDAIAFRIPRHAEADGFDDADRFVSDDQPFAHGVLPLQDVDVRPADRRDGRTEERFAGSRLGPRNLADRNLPFAPEHSSLHGRHGGLQSVGSFGDCRPRAAQMLRLTRSPCADAARRERPSARRSGARKGREWPTACSETSWNTRDRAHPGGTHDHRIRRDDRRPRHDLHDGDGG